LDLKRGRTGGSVQANQIAEHAVVLDHAARVAAVAKRDAGIRVFKRIVLPHDRADRAGKNDAVPMVVNRISFDCCAAMGGSEARIIAARRINPLQFVNMLIYLEVFGLCTRKQSNADALERLAHATTNKARAWRVTASAVRASRIREHGSEPCRLFFRHGLQQWAQRVIAVHLAVTHEHPI